MAEGFSLYMPKAVLNGRGDKIIVYPGERAIDGSLE
jgi:hypothetical protein